MKRRKNFLFSGPKRFEVRIYPYGMEGYVNQGEQNIKRKKFSSMQDACRWFDANDDYPLVELVDLEKDHLVASGGTGKKFNPKKRKRKRKPKTEVSRRDVYAEMAKARKTTRGHKRKDRKRAVARGSSRKPKHRVRLNPYDKPNKEKGVFDANVKKRQGKIFGLYRAFYNELEDQKIDIDDLPSVGALRGAAEEAAVSIESTQFPELKGQSYETIPATQAAKEALGLDEDGVFGEYATKGNRFFKAQLKSLATEIKKKQDQVKKARGATSKVVTEAKEDAEIRKLDQEIQARLQPVQAQRDQEVSVRERELASEALDEEEPLTPEQREAERKRKRSLSRRKRIARYEDHVLDTRRSDVSPPLKVLADARQDILLYALKDGTTQVWSKGAITETFLPSKKTSSVTIAHRYANWWRGLDEKGKIRDKAKKSRLRSRVLLAVEGRKGVKVIEPSIAQEIGQVQRDVIGTHGLPSLDDYELKGPRANPFVDKDFKRLSDSPKETVWGSQKHSCIIRVRHHFPHRPVLWECSDGRHGEAKSVPEAVSAIKGGRANPRSRRNSKMAYTSREERTPRSRKELIGYIYALNSYLEREFGAYYTADQINQMTIAELKKDAQRLAHWLRDTPGGDEAVASAYGNAARAYNHLENLVPKGTFSSRAKKSNPRRRKNASYVGRGRLSRLPYDVRTQSAEDQVGVAGWSDRGQPRIIHLYKLDAFDKKFYRDVPLKKGEKLFRFASLSTHAAEPHARYLVKINVDRDLIYFMTEDQPLDERMPRFKTRGLKARFLKFERNPRPRKNSSLRYRVMYASVDGAGYYKKEGEPRTWATKEAAIRFADSKQENSDKSGNPWGYYYSVHTDTYPSRVVYRTR